MMPIGKKYHHQSHIVEGVTSNKEKSNQDMTIEKILEDKIVELDRAIGTVRVYLKEGINVNGTGYVSSCLNFLFGATLYFRILPFPCFSVK